MHSEVFAMFFGCDGAINFVHSLSNVQNLNRYWDQSQNEQQKQKNYQTYSQTASSLIPPKKLSRFNNKHYIQYCVALSPPPPPPPPPDPPQPAPHTSINSMVQ